MITFNHLSKRIKIWLLLITILLGQTACQGKNPELVVTPSASNPAATHSTESVSTSPVTIPRESQSQSPVVSSTRATITFTDDSFRQSFWAPLIEEFNQSNPDVEVVFVPLARERVEGMQPDDSKDRATSADTTLVNGIRASNSAYFRDLQPLIDLDQSLNPADFWPAAVDACSDSLGRKMGLPLNLSMGLIYFDKDFFRQAGIVEPQPGWTWEDFKTSISAVAAHLSGQQLAFADAPFESILQSYLNNNLSQNNGQLNAQGLEAEISWYADLVKQGLIYPVHPADYTEKGNELFSAWQAPFKSSTPPVMWFGHISNSYPELNTDPSAVREDNDPFTHLAIDRYGVVPVPVGSASGSQFTSPSGSFQCMSISAGSEKIQAAWKWLKYLTNYWYAKNDPLLPNRLIPPVRKSVADSQGYWQTLPTHAVLAVKFALEHSFNQTGTYYEESQIIYRAIEGAFDGKDTFTNALLEAQKAIKQLPPPMLEDVPPFTVAPSQSNPSGSTGIGSVLFFPNTSAPDELAVIREAIEKFNLDHTDQFKVTLVNQFPENGEGYYGKLGQNLDCFISQTDPMNAEASGQVLALTPFFSAKPDLKQEIPADLLASSTWNDRLMSLPIVSRPPVLVYNAALLREKGIQIPGANWTLQDFSNFLGSLTDLSTDHSTFASIRIAEVGSLSVIELLMLSRNHTWLDVSDSIPKAYFNTPEMIADLSWLGELGRADMFFEPSGTAEEWWPEVVAAMTGGKVAVWGAHAGTETSQLFPPDYKPNYEIGTLPLPKLPENAGISQPVDSRGFYISSSSDNAEACWSLGLYLSGIPNLLKGVPARSSIANSPEWESQITPQVAEIYRTASNHVWTRNLNGIRPALVFPLDTWLAYVENGVLRGQPPETLVVAAQFKADSYSACLKSRNHAGLSSTDIQKMVVDCAKQADPDWE